MRGYGWSALAVVSLLVACGGGGSDPGGSDQNSEIHSYSVTGTDGVSSASATPSIAPSQNGGLFSVSWDAESSTDVYRAEVYVSRDNALSSDDKMFLGRNCNSGLGDCPNQAATYSCKFDSANVITCAAGGPGDVTNMTSYFSSSPGLPATYQLILRICDGLFSDCITRAVPVAFQ